MRPVSGNVNVFFMFIGANKQNNLQFPCQAGLSDGTYKLLYCCFKLLYFDPNCHILNEGVGTCG